MANTNTASNGPTLCIEDPLDSSNDVGRGSFLFFRVKLAFENAYATLQHELGARQILNQSQNVNSCFQQKQGNAMQRELQNEDGCNR